MCVRGRIYSSFSYVDKYIQGLLIIKDTTLLRIASAQKIIYSPHNCKVQESPKVP